MVLRGVDGMTFVQSLATHGQHNFECCALLVGAGLLAKAAYHATGFSWMYVSLM